MKKTVSRVGCVLLVLALCGSCIVIQRPGTVSSYNVLAFGARGDGETNDTAAVQRAIDTCADVGGGTVYFGPGTYLCGSLHLRSGVTLWLDAGATVKGSTERSDYDEYEKLGFKNDADHETTYFHYALIWGEDVERIGIVGEGTIDSNRKKRGGPKSIALKRCRFVQIRGIHIINAPNYAISMLGTDSVNIDGVTILNAHCDGIDPDSCRNVRISNCHIESWDDAIVPKASFSLGERRSCENITVTNCYLSTACNCFKLGTESGGDFKRIAVSNCVMSGLKGRRPATSGIALETVDGSNLDGVVVSNVTMRDVRAPIFVRLGNRGRDMETPVPGTLKNVMINNVVATGASLASSVTGIPGHDAEDVTLSNIRISYAGGSAYRPAGEPVPEAVGGYPSADMFGALPAYGLYCRHVDGLTLSNVQVSFPEGSWQRIPGHAVVCDDVTGLDIEGLRAKPVGDGAALVRFVNVRDAIVRGCKAPERTNVFLETAGPDTGNVSLTGNDLTRARTAFVLGNDVDPEAVTVQR